MTLIYGSFSCAKVLRRLSFREADSETTEKNEAQGAAKIVESHMEIQSSPEPEKHEEATKKTKEVCYAYSTTKIKD